VILPCQAIAYRFHVVKLAVPTVVAMMVAIVTIAVATGEARTAAAQLTLDGTALRPELALTPAARSRGLMNRKRAPADGMLFVFRYPTTSGFWMKNTLVPLKIVFFNADGERVRRLSMTPCRADPCPIYDPKHVYRFALELPGRDARSTRRLGPVGELRRLVRISS
jgi:uncharacterized membrane protein (UPF0127 family)